MCKIIVPREVSRWPLLAEAVEKLWAGSSARNNGFGIVG
jgi:hypothetical protein